MIALLIRCSRESTWAHFIGERQKAVTQCFAICVTLFGAHADFEIAADFAKKTNMFLINRSFVLMMIGNDDK